MFAFDIKNQRHSQKSFAMETLTRQNDALKDNLETMQNKHSLKQASRVKGHVICLIASSGDPYKKGVSLIDELVSRMVQKMHLRRDGAIAILALAKSPVQVGTYTIEPTKEWRNPSSRMKCL